MTTNPYQSPKVETTGRRAARLEDRRRGPLELAIIGLMAGGFLGATAGAAAAGTLGLTAGLVGQGQTVEIDTGDTFIRPDSDGLMIFGAFAGCFLGGLAGGPLGAVTGVLAGLVNSRWRGRLVRYPALAAALLAGTLGAMAGLPFSANKFAGGSAWIVGGSMLGGVAGLLAGGVLGRGLGILAWGRPSAEANTRESESPEVS